MPHYDTAILPGFQYTLISEQEATTRYLGGKTSVGDQYIILDVSMKSDIEARAFYKFWKYDCANGTLPFTIDLPHFGMQYFEGNKDLTVQFADNLSVGMNELQWTSKIKLKVISVDVLLPSDTLYPSNTLYPN